MKIIISPAKKMKVDTDSMSWETLPVFLNRAEELSDILKRRTYKELKSIWKCSDAIAELNMKRLQELQLDRSLTPAILAYEGIQYQYMAPGVFTDKEYSYIQDKLRILSGFYGILKPFDGVVPYRLEMQAKLQIGEYKDLYSYWGSSIAERLMQETDCVINLASKEYSMSISKYITSDIRFITCVFGEENNGKVIEKGTLCKMARGEMVRYMAEHQIEDAAQIRKFDRLNYHFSKQYSDDNHYVFLLRKDGGAR